MNYLELFIEDIKSLRYLSLFLAIISFCMVMGYMRGSFGGLITGIIVGILLSFSGSFLIHKHREKLQDLKESLIIPKIGLTEKKEQWLRKKLWHELKAEKRTDMVVKIVWWIIFAFIALNILYWISPIIYFAIHAAKR